MACVSRARMNVNSNKFILETIIFDWHLVIFILCRLSLTCFRWQFIFIVLAFWLFLRQSLFALHHVIITVWFQVKDCWELKVLIQFVVSKSVEVENNSLEMQNQDVWSLSNQNSLADINFFVAAFALVVIDNFTFNLFCQRIVNGLDVFYSERKVVVVLDSIFDLTTLLAD
jgi:hypothetical protein